MKQSTNHLLMVEPGVFYANPETADTNVYQDTESTESKDKILEKALVEFRNYRDSMVQNGIIITTLIGHQDCPDMIFPNWISTYAGGRALAFPMRNNNRQAEKTPEVMALFDKIYPHFEDWSHFEKENKPLESTSSIVADHVNKTAYIGRSARTTNEVIDLWSEKYGYEAITFDTHSHHTGVPVYHTDFLMYIGTDMVGICLDCLNDETMRESVRQRLAQTHEIIEFTQDQLRSNCCNALEVVGTDNEKMLVMSKSAFEALDDTQENRLRDFYNTLITPDLTTVERYGGGSARCMLLELF